MADISKIILPNGSEYDLKDASKVGIYIVKGTQTKTQIKKLDEAETISEIARVIAGNDITEAVLEHARELRKNKF